MRSLICTLAATGLIVLTCLAPIVSAGQSAAQTAPDGKKAQKSMFSEEGPVDTAWGAQLESLWHASARLPTAALLSAILAFRPRRRGTPKREAPVVQTQIVLALVGAMVMLVVGASLARAFGIVGAAGLIRYRAKISDPKDAGVMLSTLAIGLAAGVGLYLFAAFATLFVFIVLLAIESIDPQHYSLFADHRATVPPSRPTKDK
jgi:ABC-type Fe3+ transport system permease subunit